MTKLLRILMRILIFRDKLPKIFLRRTKEISVRVLISQLWPHVSLILEHRQHIKSTLSNDVFFVINWAFLLMSLLIIIIILVQFSFSPYSLHTSTFYIILWRHLALSTSSMVPSAYLMSLISWQFTAIPSSESFKTSLFRLQIYGTVRYRRALLIWLTNCESVYVVSSFLRNIRNKY